ncbi:MAG: hypothetical protein RIS64_454 [Bacteroidota bacterium]|jgi:hypothetical protein
MNTNYNSLEDSGWLQLEPLLEAHLPSNLPIPAPQIVEKQAVTLVKKELKQPSLTEIWVTGGCICLVLIAGWGLFQDRLTDSTAMLLAQKHQKRMQLLKVKQIAEGDSSLKTGYQKQFLDYLKRQKKQNATIERPYPIEIEVNISDKSMNY